MATFHPLLKPKHTIRELLIYFMIGIRIVGILIASKDAVKGSETESSGSRYEVSISLLVFKIRNPCIQMWTQGDSFIHGIDRKADIALNKIFLLLEVFLYSELVGNHVDEVLC